MRKEDNTSIPATRSSSKPEVVDESSKQGTSFTEDERNGSNSKQQQGHNNNVPVTNSLALGGNTSSTPTNELLLLASTATVSLSVPVDCIKREDSTKDLDDLVPKKEEIVQNQNSYWSNRSSINISSILYKSNKPTSTKRKEPERTTTVNGNNKTNNSKKRPREPQS